MLDRFLDTNFVKDLSVKSKFLRWLYASLMLRRNLKAGKMPMYLDYGVNAIPRYGYGKPLHGLLYRKLEANIPAYKSNIDKFANYADRLRKISVYEQEEPSAPFWMNGWVQGLDPIALYCFPCILNSSLYIEIGSGNSTKFVRRTIEDNDLDTHVISIDPHPRAEIDNLCDEIIRRPLEEIDLSVFNKLNRNDILVIDNSHRCFQNSDVTTVFLDILPILKPGVLVYIDDIYLPSDYPPEWRHRYYSEQYLLAVLLLSDRTRYKVVLPATFIAHVDELRRKVDALWEGIGVPEAKGHGNGFWMVIESG